MCIKLVNYWNKYTEMHGQQNVKKIPFICPHGTIRPPLDGFSWKLIFQNFSKICRECWSLIKTWKNDGTVHVDLRALMIIPRWILKMRNVSDKTTTENQNTHFVFSNFIPKIILLWDNVESYDKVGQATDNNIIQHIRFACCITKATDTLSICNTYCLSRTAI